MSNLGIGYVRIRTADTAKKGSVLDVRALVTHPMEGIERDTAGNVIGKEYRFVTKMTAYFNNKEVSSAYPTQSISINPFFMFGLRMNESGVLKVVFEDSHGQRFEASKEIKVS